MRSLFGNLIRKSSGSCEYDTIQYVQQTNHLGLALNTLKTGKKAKGIEKKRPGRKLSQRLSRLACSGAKHTGNTSVP